jgi:hypothetical protein
MIPNKIPYLPVYVYIALDVSYSFLTQTADTFCQYSTARARFPQGQKSKSLTPGPREPGKNRFEARTKMPMN